MYIYFVLWQYHFLVENSLMPTAYVMMKHAFGFRHDRIPTRGQLPDEALYLNWERAVSIEVMSMNTFDIWRWNLMFQIGFVKERIMPLADKAIQNIVGRLIDIGILTWETCSGHPFSQDDPFISLRFPDAEKEREFVEQIEKIYRANDIPVMFKEARNLKRGHIKWSRGIPKWFTQQHLQREISFEWCCRDTGEIHEVWRLFSQVLRQYDRKPEDRLEERMLRRKDEADKVEPLLERVYQDLVNDTYLK